MAFATAAVCATAAVFATHNAAKLALKSEKATAGLAWSALALLAVLGGMFGVTTVF